MINIQNDVELNHPFSDYKYTCVWSHTSQLWLGCLLCCSDIEEESTVFSMEQTEFSPRPISSFFSAGGSSPGAGERAEPLFTKLKEEPEDLLQLAPTAGDDVIPLDFGPSATLV